MAKGDDAVKRKKNRANRKKLQKKQDSSAVSARVAAIIAAKKRRKSGKRRMCQGMCFSLPTPDDPFNDQHGKDALTKTSKNGMSAKSRKGALKRNDNGADPVLNIGNNAGHPKNEQVRDLTSDGKHEKRSNTDSKVIKKSGPQGQQGHAWENSCSSKFLTLCLKTLEDALWHENTQNGDMINPLFVNAWGIEFWKLYASGKDILETSGVCISAEQIAWIVSIAADAFARKEKEGLSLTSPFLLYLVPTAEKAAEVRAICKPLKALGIHTVSIHSGASIDHQIHGLRSCEPEFLVSTPERLLELITLKAIDISQTSLLVVDGVRTLSEGAYLDMIKSVRQFISGNPRTVVFNDCPTCPCTATMQNLLNGPIERLSLDDSITSLSSCIVQSANVCTSEEEKLLKFPHRRKCT
ncbi:probable ATP-dependent RNA helicase ddx5 isoform X2 [Rhodamnia argentea]|uniref:Probable ATP-dependent RNA helicase ddx5 isoform X2 n=1 Tax=Rhodamnia argentea TaxID=178133 RepID=A0A8B8QEG1_9MYRT|nr:probable ATP-dependent RNA helicase ddx5 isoform X2 [Rhodamnia argentea]XP_048135093.1 probable ATP-dependent RNA helicase ddx5 isoform X2 [Rhodamnia argentea]